MGSYSMDLRERVAAAIDEGEGSERQIAKRFRVSVSFCTRLLQRRRDAGTLAPKPHGGGPRPGLGFPEQVRLAMLIAEHPDATLNQLKEWGGFAYTLRTIWRDPPPKFRRHHTEFFGVRYGVPANYHGGKLSPRFAANRRRTEHRGHERGMTGLADSVLTGSLTPFSGPVNAPFFRPVRGGQRGGQLGELKSSLF